MGEDRAVVRESGSLVLMGRFGEVLGETVIGVVVRHAKAAELREVSALQIGGPETERPGVNRHQQSGVPTGLGTIDETGSQLPVGGEVELEEVRCAPGVLDHLLHRCL